jgi:hypothetical protein
MSATAPSAAHALRMVRARLGREPQDMLEAAVVLEAWAGIPARQALRLGREVTAVGPVEARPSGGRPPTADAARGLALEACSFVIAVIAIAAWAGPLAGSLGRHVVGAALIGALPTTLALQWGLASRHLSRPEGLAHLGRRPAVLALVAWLALVAAPAAALGRIGALAGLLSLIWTGGAILVRRRWSPAYVGIVLLASGGMVAKLPAAAVVAGAAALTTLAVAAAVRGHVAASGAAPGRWGRVLVAAAIGAGVGVLLVGDHSVSSDIGTIPAVALLPSSLASFWAGRRLWRLQHVIPRTLYGVPVVDMRAQGLLGAAPLRILLGAVGRLLVLTVALSALLAGGARVLHLDPNSMSVVIGFGILALATLLLGLLESVGRGWWALAALAGGIGAEGITLTLTALRAVPGGGLIAGASAAVIISLPVAVAALSRPASTLATGLSIR